VREPSDGNQRKVALARHHDLTCPARQPTRGIDVASKAQIIGRRLLADAAHGRPRARCCS
jgi:ABC-type sugar transport system ATPase subunit